MLICCLLHEGLASTLTVGKTACEPDSFCDSIQEGKNRNSNPHCAFWCEPLQRCGKGLSIVSEGAWADGSRDNNQIVVLYSGFAAEQRFNPNADPSGSERDNQEASALLRSDSNSTEVELRDKAKKLVAANWPQIGAVAAALLEYETLNDGWDIIVDAVDEGEDWRISYHHSQLRATQ